MSVVPISERAEAINSLVEWAEQLRDMLADNDISALCVRGVRRDGEIVAWGLFPDNAPTIRYLMIGLLQESVDEHLRGMSDE